MLASGGGEEYRAWATEHYRKVTMPEVRQALEILRRTTLVNPLAGLGEFLLARLTLEKWAPAIGVLERFAALTVAELWQLANQGARRGPGGAAAGAHPAPVGRPAKTKPQSTGEASGTTHARAIPDRALNDLNTCSD